MVHARHALVGLLRALLLEQAQVMIVLRTGDLEEGRVGIPLRHLETQQIAVEADAALRVRNPQHEVLQALEPDARGAIAHREPPGYSTLTVMAAHAMRV